MKRLWLFAIFTSLCLVGHSHAAIIFSAEFDDPSDLGPGAYLDFQNRGASTIGGGVVSGIVSTAADVQIRSDFDVGVDAADVTPMSFFEIRFRETSDGSAFLTAADQGTGNGRLFASAVPYGPAAGNVAGTNVNLGDALSIVDDADNFVIATYSAPSSDIASLRFDPIITGAAAGATFDLDYIRLDNGVAAVPEPTSLGCLAVIGAAATWQRRRRRSATSAELR